MMDFNLILLLVGLGLLAIVILFALWGFLAGLKRELKCTAVFFILLLLAWLVFGNSGILLNYSGTAGIDAIRGALSLPTKDATLWETIVDYLNTIEGFNGEVLLVEGKEMYNLIFNISSAVATMLLLVVATLAVIIITPIIRFISHIVWLIVRAVKKKKAKKRAAAGLEEPQVEASEPKDAEAQDAVVVLKGLEGADDVVVTVTENELPEAKKTKKRIWGAVVGALKGVFLIILLFAPISGIYSVLKTVTPQTRELISDLANGNTDQKTVAETEGPTDVVFDFVDTYGESGIGKFVESSSYFFGQSFSTLLFDSAAKIQTTNQTIKLREELVVFIEAVNALHGNIELGTWTDDEIAKALDALKDSKLLPEVMPAAIEYAYEMEFIKEALTKATQEAPFLKLRNINWDKDIEKLLDALKVVYQLDIFPLEDFNYLTLNPEKLRQITDILGSTEFINQVFPVLIRTVVKLDAVEKLIGPFTQKLAIDSVDWKKELSNLVDIYAFFQAYGYTALEEITSASTNDLIENIVVDHFDTTVSILDKLIEMQLFGTTLIPVGQNAIDHFLSKEDGEYVEFANILNLKALTAENWKADFHSILESAKLAIQELDALTLDVKQMDLESEEALDAIKTILSNVLRLNILGNDETKNELLIAVFKKFNLFDVDDLYVQKEGSNELISILTNVNWETIAEGDGKEDIGEIQTLLNLVDVYAEFIQLDEVDIKNFQFDWETMLDNDNAVDILVSALEELVDSELVVSLINPAVNKYVLPITNSYDDDHLIQDIVNQIGSETIAREIINIVEAVKSANDLGLFKIKSEGLGALQYDRIEDMVTIIDTVFESQLFKGYEGRIIRIVFKATGLLDIEKGVLNDIDYTGERDKIVGFLYAVEGILKDPEFELVNEEGKINLDLEYLTQPEIFSQIMNGTEILLGTFVRDEDGNFIETGGSKLVETLLPYVYDSFLKDLIPADFVELTEILDLDNLTGEQLARDVKRLVYIAGQLVEMDLQTILVGKPIVYTDKLENIYNIIDVLLDIDMFKPCGNEVFAWTINYLADHLAGQYNIEHVTAEDFASVDWQMEATIAKEMITEIIDFLEVNDLVSTDQLQEFIQNGDYLNDTFVTNDNANRLLSILSHFTSLNTIECLLPVLFQAVVSELEDKQIIEDFWRGSLTGEQLVEDLNDIYAIASIVVNDMHVVEYWQVNFDCEMPLPEAEHINQVLDKIFGLNLVQGFEGPIVNYVLEKYLPNNLPFTVEDFAVNEIQDWNQEVTVIKEFVETALIVLVQNHFVTINGVVDAIQNGNLNDPAFVNEFITDLNIVFVSQFMEIASGSTLIANLLPSLLVYGIGQVETVGIELSFMDDFTSEELQNDLVVLSQIVKAFGNMGGSELILNQDIVIDVKSVNTILGLINELNLVTKHEAELFSTLINKAFETANLTDFTLTAEDLADVDWDNDFASLQQIVTIIGEFATEQLLISVSDLVEYVKNATNNLADVLVESNVTKVVDIVKVVANMGVVRSLLPQALEYGIEKAAGAGYDLSFLKDAELTGDELGDDLVTIANIAMDLLELKALDIYKGNPVSELSEDALRDLSYQLSQLHILGKYANDWMAFGVNFGLDQLAKAIPGFDFTVRYVADDFATLTSENWAEDTASLGEALVRLSHILDETFQDGFTITNIKEFIQQKQYMNEQYLTDTTIDNVFAALSEVIGMNVLETIVSDFVEYGVEKAVAAGYDVDFLLPIATNKVIASDLLMLADIAKVAIQFGALEYINTKDIAQLQLTLLGSAVESLNEMQLFALARNEWAALVANTVLKLVNIDRQVEASEFGELTEADWAMAVDSAKMIFADLDQVLAEWQLKGLNETITFIQGQGYLTEGNLTPAIVHLVTDIVSLIADVKVIQPMLPKALSYGIHALQNQYDLTFLLPYIQDGTLNGEALAADVKTLMSMVDDAVDFGALDIYFKKYETEEFELQYSYISSIVEKLNVLNILQADLNTWFAFILNTGFNLLHLDMSVEMNEFAYMTKEMWENDANALSSIVNQLIALLEENHFAYLSDIQKFIAGKGYLSAQYVTEENGYRVLDILATVSEINVLSSIYELVIPYGVTALNNANNATLPDLTFLMDAVDQGKLTGTMIQSDIAVLVDMVREALQFGVIEIVYDNNLSNINLDHVYNILSQVDDLHILTVAPSNWVVIGMNQILSLAKIDAEVTLSEYNTMTNEDWKNDLAMALQIVESFADLLANANIQSYDDLKNIIDTKAYTSAQYITEENVMVLADVLYSLGNIKAIQPVLDDLALLGLTKLPKETIDLSFVEDALQNGELTGKMLASDLTTLATIVQDVIGFGALEYYFYQSIDQIELSLLAEAVNEFNNLNLYNVAKENWFILGINAGFKSLGIDKEVTLVDFADLDLDQEIDYLVQAIYRADDLLTSLNLESTDDIKQFIADKNYLNGQYVTNENIDIIADIVETLAQMQVVNVLLPTIASWGVNKLQGNDLDFLKNALDANVFTGADLVDDILTVIQMIRLASEFGIFDAYFDMPIENMNPQLLADIVAELENLNIYTELRPNWLTLGLNKAFAALKLDVAFDIHDFDSFTEADYVADNVKLQNVVVALAQLCDALELNYASVIKKFIAEGDYFQEYLYSDVNVKYIETALVQLISTKTAGIVYNDLLHVLVTMVNEKGFDMSFIENAYTQMDLVDDIPTVLEIAKEFIDFGMLEYIQVKDIDTVNLEYIANAIAQLENLTLFTKFRVEWLETGLNQAFRALKLDVEIQPEQLTPFTKEDWMHENETLQALVIKLGEILNNNNLYKYSEIIAFFKDDKRYALEETYTDDNLALLADAAKLVFEFKVAEVLFPQFLDVAINLASQVNLDISFLSGQLDIHILQNDVDSLVKMFKPAVKFGLFYYLEHKELEFLNLIYLNPIIDEFDRLGTYQLDQASWAAALINCISENAKLGFKVNASDFTGIDWAVENELFQAFITQVDAFLVESDLVLYENLKEFIASGYKPQEQFVNKDMALRLVDVFTSFIELQITNVVIKPLAEYGFDQLAKRGYDYTYLLDTVTNSDLVDDAIYVLSAVQDLIHFNMVEFLYKDGEIDYNQREFVFESLRKLLDLNIWKGHNNEVLITLFTKLGVDTAGLELHEIYFADEWRTIVEILDSAFEVFDNYDLNTLAKFKAFKFDQVKIDINTNETLAEISNILWTLSNDTLVKAMALPLSAKYLDNKPANLMGLVDLHRIYPDVQFFLDDLSAIAEAIDHVASLDVYNFMVGNIDYPYTESQHIEPIIQALFNLNYFNLPNRMGTVIESIDNLLPNVDLSNVDGNLINLASDSDKIIAMYESLANVFGDPEFPIKNKADIDNNVGVSLSFFFKKWILENEINAVESYMDTTLYDQTGAAVLILLMPLLKTTLKDYWYALDLDNYSAEDIEFDVPHLQTILETIIELDPVAILDGELAFDGFKEKLDVIIDHALELRLLENHMVDVFELILRDFVYDKQLGSYYIESGAFDLTNVNLEGDAETLKMALSDFFNVMTYKSIDSLSELKAYVKDLPVKEILKDQFMMDLLVGLLDKVAELTVLQNNIKVVYDTFLVPVLEDKGYIAYFDYRQATNEEMMADLGYFADIAVLVSEFGLGTILDGADINYDQPEIVEEILTLLSQTNYLKYHVDTFIDKYQDKIVGLYTFNASYDKLTISEDLLLLAKAYKELIPFLMDARFPVKKYADFKSISVQSLQNAALSYVDEIANAYDYLTQMSLAPYFLPTIVDMAKGMVPERFQGVADVFDPLTLSFDELQLDTLTSAKLLRDLINLNVFTYLETKSAMIPQEQDVVNFINDIFDMYLFNTKFSALLEATMNALSISTEDVDFDSINWVADKDAGIALLPIVNQLVNQLGIDTIEKVVELKNILSDKALLKSYVDKLNKEMATEILDLAQGVLDLTVVHEIVLPVAQRVLPKVHLNESLAGLQEVLTLKEYDKETFNADLAQLVALGNTLLDSGMYTYYKNVDIAIDWENAYIDEMIRQVAELYFLPLYGQVVVEFVGNSLKVDLSEFNNANIDYRGEADAYVNAYHQLTTLLTQDDFPYATPRSIMDVVKKRAPFNWKYFINYVPATLLIDAFDEFNGTGFSGELYKVAFKTVADKHLVPGSSFLDPTSLSNLSLREDYATLMKLAQAAVDFIYNNGNFTRVGKDSSLENIEAAKLVIEYLSQMNLFDTKYSQIVLHAMDRFGLETEDVRFRDVNFNHEFEYLQDAAEQVLTLLSEYGVHTYKELMATVREFKDTFAMSKKEFLKKVKNALITVDVVHIVELIETLDASHLMDQLIIPVYNKYSYKFVPSAYHPYLDLMNYGNSDVEYDTHLFAVAVRNIYESEIYKAYTQNMTLTPDCIPFVQEAIIAVSQMRIVDMKKQDVVELLDQAWTKYDLSSINVENVDVEKDGRILADMIPAIYDIYLYSNSFRFRIDMLGKTELMETMIGVFEDALTMDTMQAVLPWAFRAYVIRPVQQILDTTKFSNVSDQQILDLLDDVVVALYALRDMGAFSNQGIDLTNKELTDKVFAVVYENIRLGKFQKYFDKLVRNIASYGVLPVDYSVMDTEEEAKALKEILKTLKEFITTYKSAVANKDFAMLADPTVQFDITNLLDTMLVSQAIQQVFMPVVRGSVLVATENYGKFELFNGMSNEDFMSIALPDLFQMINYAVELGIFDGKLDYKNTDAITNFIDLVVTSEVTKDACYDLFPIAIKKALKMEVTKQELLDANVDFVVEAEYIKNFLNKMKDELNNPDLSFSDVETLLKKSFLLALADAGHELENSNILQIIIKPVMKKAIHKINSVDSSLEFMLNVLDEDAYTNVYAMEDYAKLLVILEHAAEIGFFEAEGMDYAALDGHIDVLLNELFSMHAFVQNEETVVRMILNKLEFADTSCIILSTISDWQTETDAFTLMVKEIATLCANPNFDIENMTSEMFNDESVQNQFVQFVDKASASMIGRQLFKELYVTKVEDKLPADAQGLIDLDTLDPNSWANEFEKLFHLYNTLGEDEVANLPANRLLTVYEMFFGFGPYAGLEAVQNSPKEWLDKLLDKATFPTLSTGFEMNRAAITEENAYREAMAIHDLLKYMISYMDNPDVDTLDAFDYNRIQEERDHQKLAEIFETIGGSLSMRNILIGVIGDGIVRQSDSTSPFNPRRFVSTAFWNQYDNKEYDATFWDDTEFTTLAMFIASCNSLGIKDNCDIFTMDLGTTYLDITTYLDYPSQVEMTNQIGLRQLLQVMNMSKVFDVTVLGGEDGVIAQLMSEKNVVTFNRPLGTAENWNDEIKQLTSTLQQMRDLGLLEDNQNMVDKVKVMEEEQLNNFLTSTNSSDVLRPMLPEVMYNTIVTVVKDNAPALTDEQIHSLILVKYPWLANQTDTTNDIASKEEWENEIETIISYIKDPSQLLG